MAALPGLRFDEEDSAAIFQGFQLSEGLAAAPRKPTTAEIDPAPGPAVSNLPSRVNLTSAVHQLSQGAFSLSTSPESPAAP